ncbi:2-polyprenyl-6-methoxyphenol hydroxylase-like FAD-dependent oxidoreductase [Mycolicibacterium iranicum]|uniref:2-polyprenyl-6-methoxyphenol hydroxylase-like FAD-dependent oxidoreductase n=1 Tax=Mycolicibacterium iranicum TaxID=912594 RepID=A0A839QFJ8_MYCIR|nr:FAD-dependent monooxygenase [Mycolicibacterium iranicum]MBB2992906.1 2-polyprenyl-6-methoxyphenol hydroxylase-like FAD-dependent oxidoreductase [Mycolicibacterium iranicum]
MLTPIRPPTGAQGMDTGIQDVHNPALKPRSRPVSALRTTFV